MQQGLYKIRDACDRVATRYKEKKNASRVEIEKGIAQGTKAKEEYRYRQ
jgi:hypothetical protein